MRALTFLTFLLATACSSAPAVGLSRPYLVALRLTGYRYTYRCADYAQSFGLDCVGMHGRVDMVLFGDASVEITKLSEAK